MELEKVTFSVKEAATILGIGTSKMYELVRTDKVPNIKLGKRFVVPRVKFIEWVNKSVVGGE